MKKFMSLVFAGVAVFTLSACGGGDDDSTSVPKTYKGVEIKFLNDGFIIDGHNEADDFVTLEYCNGDYLYRSGDGHWYGYFRIKNDRINMYDKTSKHGGSYRIDTGNAFLEVGEEYSIDFQNDEIIVDTIIEDVTCD